MRRPFQFLIVFLVVASVCLGFTLGSANAQSESPVNGETSFGSIELTENWTTIESNMAIIVVTDRGQIEIYPGNGDEFSGTLRAMLVDGQIASGMISTPPPGTEMGQPVDGLALVIENTFDGSGATYFGYLEIFDFQVVVLPEDITVSIYS